MMKTYFCFNFRDEDIAHNSNTVKTKGRPLFKFDLVLVTEYAELKDTHINPIVGPAQDTPGVTPCD